MEWAHAIAPGARILLVEANSANLSDLLTAVNYARNQPGVSVVSMSWGAGEFSGENSYDSYFTTPAGHAGVTFVASSGDSGSAGAPEWPSIASNVLAVGGTQLATDASGNYVSETAWSGSGGGISAYESQPSFQKGVVTQSTTKRTVPDVAYDGSGSSPFAVYDTYSYSGWLEVYGTSAGAPQWSALVALADQGRALAGEGTLFLDGPTQTLSAIYQLPASDFHDVTSGSNGGYSAGAGYDLVTGRGSPLANLVVAGLVGGTTSTPPPSSGGSRHHHRSGRRLQRPRGLALFRVHRLAAAIARRRQPVGGDAQRLRGGRVPRATASISITPPGPPKPGRDLPPRPGQRHGAGGQ